MEKAKVLFNEKCMICNFEINHYKKRSKLKFQDCSSMNDKYLKKLHVVFENGKELSGVDAFIYVWHRTNGYPWRPGSARNRPPGVTILVFFIFIVFFNFHAGVFLDPPTS